MRDSEVQELRRGCHAVATGADGVISRHRISGVTFKGRGAQGAPAQWVVIPPVGDAVAALEQLHDHDHLFGTVAWPARRARQGGASPRGAVITIVKRLNAFTAHVNATQVDPNGGAPAISPWEGRPWHLTTGQFRRTLAWHIARQPFGVVAGAIQYQHQSVAVFEGYAGRSASGFRQEVEIERRLAVLDDLVEDYLQHRRGARATGAGCRSTRRAVRPTRQRARGRPRSRSRPPASDAADTARNLHPGALNDCFYDPDHAECHKRATGADTTRPLALACQPAMCRNSVITEAHLPRWEEAVQRAQVHLRRKVLTGLQRRALHDSIETMQTAIAPLKGSAT